MLAAAPDDVRIFIPPVDVPQKPPYDARITTLSGQAFGTSWQVKAVLGAHEAGEVQARIEACLSEIDLQMSPYKPHSDLCRFNGAGPWQHVNLPPMLLDVVAKANSQAARLIRVCWKRSRSGGLDRGWSIPACRLSRCGMNLKRGPQTGPIWSCRTAG
ncbi:MAG: hypothetical protein B7Z26_06360 [Asticcacaulis sp. 32-58-5]|nr:MAG: hypothetical protein B7Z26_06360 [Asticcacaulis sp. 32-58-5]